MIEKKAGMRIRIRSEPLIFGPPDPDPTCNNGFIKLFSFWTNYTPELPNSSIKWWFMISNLMPTYLKYEYIFSSFRLKVGTGSAFFFQPDPDPWKKNVGSSSLSTTLLMIFRKEHSRCVPAHPIDGPGQSLLLDPGPGQSDNNSESCSRSTI